MDGVSVNAFEALDFIDIVLLLLAIGAAALIVLVAMDKIDASLHRFVETIGGVAAIAVLLRIVIQPDGASLKWGIFVALIGAVGDRGRSVPHPDGEDLTTTTCSASAPCAP